MLLSIAWRNLIRSKRRTAVTFTFSMLTTLLFVFYMALMDGSYAKMFKDSVEIYPGYIQITQTKYKDEPSNDALIFETQEVLKTVRALPEVDSASARFESFGLYSTDENSIAGLFSGIDPLNEPKMSRIKKTLKEGRYLKADDTNNIIIGQGLAKRLNAKLGDKVALVTSGADYSFTADNLYIVGIFKSGLLDFDNSASFINKTYFDKLMSTNGSSSHIIVRPKKIEKSAAVAAKIQSLLDTKEYRVEDWHRYMKDLIDGMELDRISGMIMLWIFVFIIFFVIIIYTFLAIYARIKEIGIMRALGTSPKQIIGIIVSEAMMLALISVVIGGALGGYLAYYYEINPIQLPEFEEMYQQYGIIEAVLPADFTWSVVFKSVTYVFVLNLISVIYPIWHVLSYKPVEAIHHV